MYDKLCYDLNIDCTNALLSNVDIRNYSSSKPEGLYLSGEYGQWCELESQALKQYFCQNWLEEVNKKLNLVIDGFMVFTVAANKPVHNVHIDIFDEPYVGTASFGLNFCPFGGYDSYMKWFKFKDGVTYQPQENQLSVAGTKYNHWEASELDEIASHSIGNSLTLVRTDVPHGIETTNSDRWSISFRVRNKNIRTWEDVCNHLNHLITSN